MDENLRGGLLLTVYAAMLIAAPPALDFLPKNQFKTPESRAKASEQYGALPVAFAAAVSAANRELRIPAASTLLPVQRMFRIEQTWNFYAGGLDKLHRLEVWVDDAMVYRSGDPEHDWFAPQLTTRRLRPIVQATVVTRSSRNARSLARFVVSHAREDFPEARTITLKATRGHFPGTEMRVHHTLTAEAPDWDVVVSQ